MSPPAIFYHHLHRDNRFEGLLHRGGKIAPLFTPQSLVVFIEADNLNLTDFVGIFHALRIAGPL